jgi:adenylate cyclase
MSQSRRLAAILAADVVGYSRLMGADEEGTLERLKTLRHELIDRKIANHHGRIVKTAGDGLLVEFASVVDAVRCAAEVQQAMPERNTDVLMDRKIELRIGINLGDVIADGGDLYGDGVNIAARIEALAYAGGVFVSGTVYDQVRDRLPFGFEDRGEQQVKNIARPVRVYRLLLDEVKSASGNMPPPLPDKPSIAVLAFTNMSGDPEQEFFADGLADDIITELSRNTSLLVISRHSSFSFRGPATDVKQVARELGVRYVVEGSVRRAANWVRVNAQLVDAELGSHIWAERYDRALEDVFAVQDEIVSAVTTAINPIVDDAEQRRAAHKHPESLSAWEAYQRGRSHMLKFDAAENARARAFFLRAIELNPNFVPAYSALALTYHYEGSRFATRPLNEANEEAQRWAQRAVDIDPADADAQVMIANLATLMGDHDAARERTSRALASAQISPWSIGIAAGIRLNDGRSAEARELLFTAMRRSPRDPLTAGFLRLVAQSYYFERNFESAVEAAKRAVAFQPDNPMPYRWLAASLGQVGRLPEAREALRRAVELSPDTFDIYVRNRPPWFRPQDHELMLEGLLKAGWQG